MKMQAEKTTTNLTINNILGEIETLDWLSIGINNLAILKKLATALRSGDLDKAATVCGDFKGHFKHKPIDSLLRGWQERLWKSLEDMQSEKP